jgi:single-stranded DNA-binding protein
MATITLVGKVVGKAGVPAVSVKEFTTKNGTPGKLASFSLNDREYCYFKNRDDNPGQFYRVELVGRDAEIAIERIELGKWVSVTGQGVWRQYNGQKYYDVKNAKVVIAEDRKSNPESDDPF